jgi:hypothetical protein
MGREPISSNELLNAARHDNEAAGLVSVHLAARVVERRVLLVTSIIGLIGIAILVAVLLQNTPSIVAGN